MPAKKKPPNMEEKPEWFKEKLPSGEYRFGKSNKTFYVSHGKKIGVGIFNDKLRALKKNYKDNPRIPTIQIGTNIIATLAALRSIAETLGGSSMHRDRANQASLKTMLNGFPHLAEVAVIEESQREEVAKHHNVFDLNADFLVDVLELLEELLSRLDNPDHTDDGGISDLMSGLHV